MEWYHYFFVATLGFVTGISELLSRYKDSPVTSLFVLPAIAYIGINIATAMLALKFTHLFSWEFGATGKPEAIILTTQILVSGLGSMMLFRSSLFTARIGNSDYSIGPNGVLQVILSSADRGVDRARAHARADDVSEIMKNVSFQKAHLALPSYCFALMQNVSAEEQKSFAQEVASLASSNIDNDIKSLNLGLALMNIVGRDVLKNAVYSIGSPITKQPQP